MSVNKQIGFFGDIIEKSQIVTRQSALSSRPVALANDQFIDATGLKIKGGVRDSDGASGVMHWNFHSWGDVDNVVGP